MEYYKILDLDSLENEIWRDVIGYEGLYKISSLGRVKSLKYGKEKILKLGKNNYGYLIVVLCKEGTRRTCKVHRLVAIAFIPNPSNLPQVNHKDENPSNNKVENLEWCDATYNLNYGTRLQRIDYKARTANTDYKAISEKLATKLSRQVYQYTLEGNLVKIWQSTNECGRNGFNQGTVSACCRCKRKTHKGFIWSYTPIEGI